MSENDFLAIVAKIEATCRELRISEQSIAHLGWVRAKNEIIERLEELGTQMEGAKGAGFYEAIDRIKEMHPPTSRGS